MRRGLDATRGQGAEGERHDQFTGAEFGGLPRHSALCATLTLLGTQVDELGDYTTGDRRMADEAGFHTTRNGGPTRSSVRRQLSLRARS